MFCILGALPNICFAVGLLRRAGVQLLVAVTESIVFSVEFRAHSEERPRYPLGWIH